MQFVITVYDGAGMLAKRMEVRNSAIRAYRSMSARGLGRRLRECDRLLYD